MPHKNNKPSAVHSPTQNGMKKTSVVFLLIFVALAVLHQDAWNWSSSNLVFGFMPVGLAYHALYSITAALFWGIVIKFAWPDDLEEWAEGEENNSTS